MAGKLKGVMPAVTPSGTRYETRSMSLAILDRVSPSCRLGMLQQCSTTSVCKYKKIIFLHCYKVEDLRRLFPRFSVLDYGQIAVNRVPIIPVSRASDYEKFKINKYQENPNKVE